MRSDLAVARRIRSMSPHDLAAKIDLTGILNCGETEEVEPPREMDDLLHRQVCIIGDVSGTAARGLAKVFSAIVIVFATPPAGASDPLAGRPAFALGDQEPARAARCGELRAMTAGLAVPDYRIDLAIEGRLTGVHTDGALWYLTMCSLPDIAAMCVTYSDNGMEVGDLVGFGGGYTRLNTDQVMLDPCLANRME